jgi:primosomal protein N' (replication factor Y)
MYPPFCRIVRLVFRGPESERLLDSGRRAVAFIQERTQDYLSLLGPAMCPISRIKKNYRVHVILKLRDAASVKPVLGELQDKMRTEGDHYLEIDIDPMNML